jgi:hypothetical protein
MSYNYLDSFNTTLNNLVQFNDKLTQSIISDKQKKDDFLQYANTELGIEVLNLLNNYINQVMHSAALNKYDMEYAILEQKKIIKEINVINHNLIIGKFSDINNNVKSKNNSV